MPVSAADFAAEMVAYGMPEEHAVPVAELTAEVLDGRNLTAAPNLQPEHLHETWASTRG